MFRLSSPGFRAVSEHECLAGFEAAAPRTTEVKMGRRNDEFPAGFFW